ncbi:DUF2867 domain-containing protein [Bradyrhizobium sp. LHD-71]|uniref:DUF2867 domain-containing protein n=1 Tax=Bradyrhizobium sp. LHD-71 TaxID=3072141 RepID=UPI00280D21F2|nr:DUF2867 domain-containing protein [Bradyrhizobium sp. LHD-71]MDQ8730130.1 DUF2867 domain-containing protein [Bradyrhizobium sp. LHD-71]
MNPELRSLLPDADFADAFSLVVDDPALDAVTAAHRAMERPPGWIVALMALRDVLVRPLGLRTRYDPQLVRTRRIGAFPVLSQNPARVVMGLDDSHLDFRLVIDVTALDDRRREIVATTLVRTHNRLGRTYLMVILPFHRRIVPGIMAQVAHEISPKGLREP